MLESDNSTKVGRSKGIYLYKIKGTIDKFFIFRGSVQVFTGHCFEL